MSRTTIVALVIASAVGVTVISQTLRPAPVRVHLLSPVTIPFELVNRHIVLGVAVNGSRPLSFVLDTGDKFAILDIDRAKELGVTLGGSINVDGVGPQSTVGAFVKDAAFTVPGLPGFSQPVVLAMPLRNLAPRLGRDFDGVIGADFISQFVLEVDYQASVITLHDRETFAYAGSGESVPVHLNSSGHPIIEAEVTPIGGPPIGGRFSVDIGSSGSLTLSSPFAAAHHLPGPGVRTIDEIGSAGTGGASVARIGRVAALKIARFTLDRPIASFSEDKGGSFASSSVQGNIGQQVMSRFKLFLDYSHDRIILEPNSTFADPFDRAFSGASIEAEGADYKTLRVKVVRPDSPASEAGLQVDDLITAIDGRPAAAFTLSAVLDMLQRPVSCTVTARRGEHTLVVTITPRREI